VVELPSQKVNEPLMAGVTTGQEIFPGEPISLELFTAMKAPLTPTELSCEIAVLLSPAALSKLLYGADVVEAPNDTLA
jgi:hypothetical protein